VPGPAIVTVQNLVKSFGSRTILDRVSFAVHEGDRIALVGVNGAGKSTLLRYLAGSLDEATTGPSGERDTGPESGLITRRRGLTIEYVAQEPRLDPDRTVADTLRDGLRVHSRAVAELDAIEASLGELEGAALDEALVAQAALHEHVADLGGFDQDHEIRGLAAALDLPPQDARIGVLSMGERRRVALARALLACPELLALDEPTNHLDAQTIAWLEDRLLTRAGALLLVTHDRYFLDRVATRILELDRGGLHSYDGGYREFLVRQAERLANETERGRARAAFVRREIHWIRAKAPARTTKQKARIDRFDPARAGGHDAIHPPGPVTLRLQPATRLGNTILELLDLTVKIGDRTLVDDLTLRWKPRDRIGIVGRNGAGKTTLIRTILGERAPTAGRVVVGQNTRFAFMDQARSELRDDHTVLQEVTGDQDAIMLVDGPVHPRTFLRMLLFDDNFADAKVGVLSGGERNRVQLAKLLRSGANFLILDEPTNDLDVMTLGVLEEALAAFPGCALIVSHDRWFLDKVATGILAFEGDGKATFYEGSCSDYLARVKAREEAAAGAVAASASAAAAAAKVTSVVVPGPAAGAGPRARKRSFKEQQELAGIEAAIEVAEREVETLEAALQDPAAYAERSVEVPAMVAALETARRRVDALYARWQELEAIAPRA
jgi:ATP-binding cassette subfamily F protein uup